MQAVRRDSRLEVRQGLRAGREVQGREVHLGVGAAVYSFLKNDDGEIGLFNVSSNGE